MITLCRTSRQLTVLRIIRRHGPITRAQIGLRAKLSAAQVSRLTNDLIERGLVETQRAPAGSRSRPADRLALTGSPFVAIGLDIGGIHQRAVVTNLRGDVLASIEDSENLSIDADNVIDYLEELIRRVLTKSEAPADHVLGLGASFRAIVDPALGVVTLGPEAPSSDYTWRNLAVRDRLAKRLPWERIAVDDTARVLALAEARYGHGAHEPDFAYVLADTGIGASLIFNAKPYLGANGVCGEIGHMTISSDGPVCACGRQGCVESYASSLAVLERANRMLSMSIATVDELDDLASDGNADAVAILTEAGAALGCGLSALLNVICPKLIVISGSMARSDMYLNAAWNSAKNGAIAQAARDVRLIPSRLGPLAGATGSAAMILDQVLEAR